MEAQWLADRTTLRTLLRTQPQWTVRDFAEAIGRSRSWIKKWRKRLGATPSEDDTVLHSHSRAPKHPPPPLDQRVIDRILEIRDQPPANLHRIPGPKAILYFLGQDSELQALGLRLPRSTRTVWQILRQYGRIAVPGERRHTPVDRPAPMTAWQFDFKDVSTVPADPDGKQQHVVEVLNTVLPVEKPLPVRQTVRDTPVDVTPDLLHYRIVARVLFTSCRLKASGSKLPPIQSSKVSCSG